MGLWQDPATGQRGFRHAVTVTLGPPGPGMPTSVSIEHWQGTHLGQAAPLKHLGVRAYRVQYDCGCEWEFPPEAQPPRGCPEHAPAQCAHDWLNVTPLGQITMEFVCRKCAARTSAPTVPATVSINGQQYPAATKLSISNTTSGQAIQQILSASGWPSMPTFGPSYSETQSDPPRELELAFDTEPIVGWRMWRVVPFERHGGLSEPRLAPLTDRELWQPRRRFEAVCGSSRAGMFGTPTSGGHEAPWRDCQCGVWAVRDRAVAEQKARGSSALAAVVGEVYLWGRVLEFREGWRGQYAYPKSLRLFGGEPARKLAENLERIYGVQVEWVPNPGAYITTRATAYEVAAGMAATATAAAKGMDEALRKFREQLMAMPMPTERDTQPAVPKRKTLPPPRPKPTSRDAFKKR